MRMLILSTALALPLLAAGMGYLASRLFRRG